MLSCGKKHVLQYNQYISIVNCFTVKKKLIQSNLWPFPACVIDIKPKVIWFFSEIDLIPFSVTLGVGVFVSVEMGMIAGTLTHLAILLYTSNTPKINIEKVKVIATKKVDGALCQLFCPFLRNMLFTFSYEVFC